MPPRRLQPQTRVINPQEAAKHRENTTAATEAWYRFMSGQEATIPQTCYELYLKKMKTFLTEWDHVYGGVDLRAVLLSVRDAECKILRLERREPPATEPSTSAGVTRPKGATFTESAPIPDEEDAVKRIANLGRTLKPKAREELTDIFRDMAEGHSRLSSGYSKLAGLTNDLHPLQLMTVAQMLTTSPCQLTLPHTTTTPAAAKPSPTSAEKQKTLDYTTDHEGAKGDTMRLRRYRYEFLPDPGMPSMKKERHGSWTRIFAATVSYLLIHMIGEKTTQKREAAYWSISEKALQGTVSGNKYVGGDHKSGSRKRTAETEEPEAEEPDPDEEELEEREARDTTDPPPRRQPKRAAAPKPKKPRKESTAATTDAPGDDDDDDDDEELPDF